MPDHTAPIPPITPYQCRRCRTWTTLATPCVCGACVESWARPLDLPSFLAGGIVFTVLFLLLRLAWWLVR